MSSHTFVYFRNPLLTITTLALMQLVPMPADAQSRAPIRQKAPPQPSAGPTLEETRAWLENDMRPLLITGDDRRATREDRSTTTTITSRNVRLDGCTLRFSHESNRWTFSLAGREQRVSSGDYEVPMADIDVAAIVIDTPWKLSDEEWERQPIEITLRTRSAVGPTIVARSHQGLSGVGGSTPRAPNEPYRQSVATLPADGDANAQRIIRALTRAAELCGAVRPTF